MAFITVADEVIKKSTTSVQNVFITKYLTELDPIAVKIYLFTLYLAQNGLLDVTVTSLSEKLNLGEDELKDYFTYLEEFELVAITSYSPFEIRILDCENYYGKPKKLHPEKYEGMYEEIQSIITGRMVSQDEYREYLILLEDCGFERNAIIMIVNYCVNLKGDKIGAAYIKKVAKNFCADGVVTATQVEERLSSYTTSTAALLHLFSVCSIKRNPEVEDGELYEKWLKLGFAEDGITAAAKCFKVKRMDKLDAAIEELYKNKKFDPKEISDYRKNRDGLFEIAVNTAKALGVYVADPTPYVENYVGIWAGYGFSAEAIGRVASYCFLSGRNSFVSMHEFIVTLYDDAFVDDESVAKLIDSLSEDDKFIRRVLSACGLTRKIISYDRQALSRWRDWGFNEAMVLKAAELSAGKNNPVAAMNYLLSTWKNGNIFTVEDIPASTSVAKRSAGSGRRYTNESYTGVLDESLAAMRRAALRDSEDKKDG